MANLERNYTVPLRQYWRMAPRYKRAKRAVNGLRRFVIRHMKVEEVKIGKELNDFILERGQRKPPARVQVTIIKEDMVGKVNIMGIPYSKEVKEEKKKLFGKSSLEKSSQKEKEEKAETKEEKLLEKASAKEAKEAKEEHQEKKEHEVKKEEKPKVKKAVKKKDNSEDKK